MNAPDPLGFALEALAARGALVERSDGDAVALLPAEVAGELGLDEEVRLTLDSNVTAAAARTVQVGLGAPLLETLIARARASIPVASVRVALEAPRAAQVRAAAERLAIRNGVSEVVEAGTSEGVYLAASMAWTAEADDRYEGIFTLVIDATAGGAPDEEFCALLDPFRSVAARVPAQLSAPPLDRVMAWLARRGAAALREPLGEVRESVARREAREHARIAEYFAALVDEAKKPRRAATPEAVAAKVAQFVRERDAKLQDLAARYAVRASLRPMALVWASARTATASLRLRRRKGERELTVRLPAGARSLDRIACDGCLGTTAQPLLCDDKLHVLCETCVPSAQGRPRCPACGGASR